MTKLAGWSFHILMMALSLPIAAYALIYVIPDAPGRIEIVMANAQALPFLPLHAGAGAVALALGPLQFWSGLRRSRPGLHRGVGMLYVIACLVGAIAGMVLATSSASGLVPGLGFGLAGLFWFALTALGFMAALDRRFPAHRAWMVRSFAMTFSAVTLRIQLGIAFPLGYAFEDIYGVLAFSSWIPNLIVAEIWLRLTRSQNQPASRKPA